MAIAIFLVFVLSVLGISFYLGSKAKSAKGYYAAHGQIHWFVNGVAFAGDYLSAASFLGICGMIALFGYDGFLYSIGYLAGWVVALFVIAEPLKRMGRFTFADALDARFHSRGIKLSAALGTLVISVFYLIPQMVGAGALVKPLLGLDDVYGILIVGAVVTTIVVTAGMVSTTWVQFIKGSLLVIVCFILTCMILNRGLERQEANKNSRFNHWGAAALRDNKELEALPLPDAPAWKDFLRFKNKTTGRVSVWHKLSGDPILDNADTYAEAQTVTEFKDPGKPKWFNGTADGKLRPVGGVFFLPEEFESQQHTGPLGAIKYLTAVQNSVIVQLAKGPDAIKNEDGSTTTVYYPKLTAGSKLMTPGNNKTFAGIRSKDPMKKLDFISLMLALFCGTASLPHILIRYYTVKDQASVRKSTVVGIAAIGFFYVLTLYLGFGAMTSGTLNLLDPGGNSAAPLLAKSFSEFLFALISAIAFTTVLGTVSGLILAGSGAVAHDLMENFLKIKMNDHQKVRYGRIAAMCLGAGAMALGVLFKGFNVSFLVGWAFNVAASANLPSLAMLLFWKGTTKQGITAAVTVGMLSSVGWILVSASAFENVYHYSAAEAASRALVPFSQPALVTVPLGYLVLIVVSLLTQRTGTAAAVALQRAGEKVEA